MPKQYSNISPSDSDATLLKYVDGRPPVERSVSESSQKDGLNTCSLLSTGNSFFSERTGSIPPLPPRISPPCSTQNLPQVENIPLPIRPRISSPSSQHRGTSHHRRSFRPSPFLQRRFLIILVLISLTFSCLVVSLATWCIIKKIMPALNKNTFHDGDFEPCVLYDQLRDYSGQIIQHGKQLDVKAISDGSEQCCARNSGQMSTLFQIIIKKQLAMPVSPSLPAKRKFRSSVAFAHKQLMPFRDEESHCGHEACHLKISSENSSSQHTRNVISRNNWLQIIFPGCYFIYSSINFKPRDQRSCKVSTDQIFRHLIMKQQFDTKSKAVLIETVHKCCDNCYDDHHTSYAGGVFKLSKNDHIFVNVMGDLTVLFNQDGSYIGLVLLDGMKDCTTVDNR